ncbi:MULTISPECIES: alpha/beta fold hydrolase [unclassified Psychrobacter]|jgi:pimeloyl-ACP methyl ester carboxylesterase|uniref:alpha/beta fold hydrolase n=1 Tax=unclassified Psychrobacter TaxID=196806 RepID=UPI00188B15EC|nr:MULTISPECIES: alpha/beta hydrolase [unclassified Psychrobacter]MBF4490355.1 alpha/beta hydrolase [Psychrobacter sp. N25K4-3-2]MBP3946608.1 alpha/beta hydrolase [Psychrobacter sp. K31L]
MPYVNVAQQDEQSVDLYYEVQGTGKPVVLIHGWPLSGRAWEAQLPALVEAGYQVITYDRRGFGQSAKPWNGYDYDTLAQDLKALMDELDLTDATIVGFSMGGGEVARYLGKFGSERISKAVLASAVPPYLFKADDNPDGALAEADIQEFLDGVSGDRIAFLNDFTKNFFTPADGKLLVSKPMRLYNRDIASFASAKATYDCVKSFSYTDFRDDLKKFDVPTLVIHGDADQIVPFEASGQRSHDMIADSQLHIVEGGPHGINVTHAKEFNDTLIAFLNS